MNFRDWLNLDEMPLANYKWQFNQPRDPSAWRKPNSSGTAEFDSDDKKVISHPKTAQKLEAILSRTSYRFNILMIETRVTESEKDQYLLEVEEFMRQNNIQQQGHITFAKNSTSGIPTTPWIMLHTMGHAIMKNNNEIYDKSIEILKAIPYTPANPNLGGSSHERISNIASGLKFQSAKNLNRDVNSEYKLDRGSFEELLYELFAEWLWHGRRIRHSGNQTTQAALDGIAQYFQRALDNAVGTIIIDLYEP